MLRRDRVEPTRVAVALVAGEREFGPSEDEPALGRLTGDVDSEPGAARIAGSCSCGVQVLEPSFEPSTHEANVVAYAATRGHRARPQSPAPRVSTSQAIIGPGSEGTESQSTRDGEDDDPGHSVVSGVVDRSTSGSSGLSVASRSTWSVARAFVPAVGRGRFHASRLRSSHSLAREASTSGSARDRAVKALLPIGSDLARLAVSAAAEEGAMCDEGTTDDR